MAKEKNTRKNIEDLINETSYPTSIEDIDNNTIKFEKTPENLVKAEETRIVKSNTRAKQMMESLVRVYVSDKFIKESQYVKAKLAINTNNLSAIIKQQSVCEDAINTIMKLINIGEDNPKLFDVLATLQKTMQDLIKTQQVLITTVEEDFKRIGTDIDKNKSDDDKDDGNNNGVKSNSTKDILTMINKAITTTKTEQKSEPEENNEENQ